MRLQYHYLFKVRYVLYKECIICKLGRVSSHYYLMELHSSIDRVGVTYTSLNARCSKSTSHVCQAVNKKEYKDAHLYGHVQLSKHVQLHQLDMHQRLLTFFLHVPPQQVRPLAQ